MTRLATKDNKQGYDHCSKLAFPGEKRLNPTHYASDTYGGAKIYIC